MAAATNSGYAGELQDFSRPRRRSSIPLHPADTQTSADEELRPVTLAVRESHGRDPLLPDLPTAPLNAGDSTIVERQDLGLWDVASVIFNKMVGTGIFTAPGHVLKLTGSKGLSLGLWVVGGAYTALWYSGPNRDVWYSWLISSV